MIETGSLVNIEDRVKAMKCLDAMQCPYGRDIIRCMFQFIGLQKYAGEVLVARAVELAPKLSNAPVFSLRKLDGDDVRGVYCEKLLKLASEDPYRVSNCDFTPCSLIDVFRLLKGNQK